MRPPRFMLVLFCFILLPILLTILSLLSAHPQPGAPTDSSLPGSTNRLRSLFSFHAPSSLFPPSAIISLTDDNSTFFLARPAAFGPLLPSTGLSGQLWIGSGFGDDVLRKGGVTTGAEGELGCSDVPGWDEGDKNQNKDQGTSGTTERVAVVKSQAHSGTDSGLATRPRSGSESVSELSERGGKVDAPPSESDGTDDHLHHPLPESAFPDASPAERVGDKHQPATHADIQSLQESAEITGKIVLLSRGGCGFLEKVKWVQRRGGIALIVGDNTRGGGLVTMYARGDTSNVTIPALFTSHTTAHLLSSLIPPENSPEDGSSDDPARTALGDDKSKQRSNQRGKLAPGTASAKPISKATSATRSKSNGQNVRIPSHKAAKPGFIRSLLSFVGLWSDNAYSWHIHEDSRRPPSSGSLNWVLLDDRKEGGAPDSKKKSRGSTRKTSGDETAPDVPNKPQSHQSSSDDFVIGVQDWRDPDLVPAGKDTKPKSTTPKQIPSPGSKEDDRHRGGPNPSHGSNALKGGSITPGSGEYINPDKFTESKGESGDANPPSNSPSDWKPGHDGHWWSGWGGGNDGGGSTGSPVLRGGFNDGPDLLSSPPQSSPPNQPSRPAEHEGLWVTLTPTSMSTSPFFDTLLVLVVSPLVTLTVVYALLLLRSRIRRRRWRAPKAVVDRLPVRTYHTMPSMSSASNSPRPATPESSSPASPLLSHSRPRSPHPRPRSQTTCGIIAASSNSVKHGIDPTSSAGEKSSSESTLWRRRYTGRQVECVVCLEEYVDGQSRVMSLPCGHEFHAECITPWLTTRRRTCPICKGDVVRSIGNRSSNAHGSDRPSQMTDDIRSHITETRNDSLTSTIPITSILEDSDSDLERGDASSASFLDGSSPAQPQPSWRNLASLSFSALSGDTMWHEPRADRNR